MFDMCQALQHGFRSILRTGVVIGLLALCSPPVMSDSLAILIGFQNYKNSGGSFGPLPFTAQDLMSMRNSLLDIGFRKEQIVIYSDADEPRNLEPYDEVSFSYLQSPTAPDMMGKISDFISKRTFRRGDVFLVYLTGHGGTFEKRRYFALPTTRPDQLSSYLSIDELLNNLYLVQKAHPLLLVDTCANLLTKKGYKIQMEPEVLDSVNRIFSSDLHTVSRFDEKLSKSVFTHYLSDSLVKNYANSRDVLTDVQERVPLHPVPALSVNQRRILPPTLVQELMDPENVQIPQGHMRYNFNIGAKSGSYARCRVKHEQTAMTADPAAENYVACLDKSTDTRTDQ